MRTLTENTIKSKRENLAQKISDRELPILAGLVHSGKRADEVIERVAQKLGLRPEWTTFEEIEEFIETLDDKAIELFRLRELQEEFEDLMDNPVTMGEGNTFTVKFVCIATGVLTVALTAMFLIGWFAAKIGG